MLLQYVHIKKTPMSESVSIKISVSYPLDIMSRQKGRIKLKVQSSTSLNALNVANPKQNKVA